MPGFCYIYREDVTEEDSSTHTHTYTENTPADLHAYVFTKTVTLSRPMLQ